MYFYSKPYIPGSREAMVAFFEYAQAVLKKLVPYYSGPINPHQRLRYVWRDGLQAEEHPNYLDKKEFVEPLNDLYIEGFYIYQTLKCSFSEFRQALLFGNHLLSSQNYYIPYRRPDKSGGKYTKQPHHQKKTISEKEQSRLDWREKKGFTRDYRRQNRSFRGRCKKIRKIIDNKQHRAWERNCLAHEQFDELYNGKNKIIFNAWKID
jgi:hypothetical protein